MEDILSFMVGGWGYSLSQGGFGGFLIILCWYLLILFMGMVLFQSLEMGIFFWFVLIFYVIRVFWSVGVLV